MKIYLYFIGKPRDEHANAIAEEFLKRSSRYSACEMREIRPGRFDLFAKHASASKVFLDPAGRTMDSAKFTAMVAQNEREARDIVFLIGGHDGLPPEWKPRAHGHSTYSRRQGHVIVHSEAWPGPRRDGRLAQSRLGKRVTPLISARDGKAGSIC